jgi:hypothetical protein
LKYRIRPVRTRNPTRCMNLVTLDPTPELAHDRVIFLTGEPTSPYVELGAMGNRLDVRLRVYRVQQKSPQ